MNAKALFSSETDEWSTPQEFFEKYDAVYHFEVDVCATAENAKCRQYFDKSVDGLAQEWRGVCWMNPPYGREIAKWVQKAAESHALVCCLLPARTDTAWWHDFVLGRAQSVEFVRGRLKFGGRKMERHSQTRLLFLTGGIMKTMLDLNAFAKEVHAVAVAHGWWGKRR